MKNDINMNIEGITSGVESRYNHQLSIVNLQLGEAQPSARRSQPLARRSQLSNVHYPLSIVTALLIVFCLLVGGKAWGQSTVNWGTASDYDGQTSSAYNSPYGRYYGWEYKVFCYRPNTLPFSGNISKIEFLPSTTNSTAGTSTSSTITINGVSDNHAMQIWMKDVEGDYSLVANTTFESYVSGATKVYSGNIPATTSGSMNAITLSTNFLHNQANSLLILVRTVANGNTGDGAVNCYYKTLSGGVNLCWYKQQDRSDPGINTSGTCITNNLPVLKVTYTTSPSITLSPSSATILTGSTQTLTATRHNVTGSPTITYTSSNTSVATVSGSGTTATVTGVSAGTATITAKMTYNGTNYTATCAITVKEIVAVGNGWSDDFEGASCGWDLINGDCLDVWVWGTAKCNGGTHALYISDNGGSTCSYSHNSVKVFATKLLNFTDGEFTFSYDWAAKGESNYDFLRVALVPASQTLTAGTDYSTIGTSTLPTGWIALDGGSKLNLQEAWQNKEVTINVTAGNYYLVFAWRSDTSTQYNPPAAVDNVSITKVLCSPPTNLSVSNITTTGATISWEGDADSYQCSCVLSGSGPVWNSSYWTTSTTNTYSNAAINSPQPNTEYDFYVRAKCGSDYSEAVMITFRTACGEESIPWSEDFEGEVNASSLPYCWEKVGSGTVAVQATNVHGGSKSLKFSGASSNLILLPEFSQELNTLQVSLWTRPESTLSSCGSFDVGYVTDASDASTFVSVKTYSYSDFPSASYAEEIVYLVSAPSGARLAFRHRPSSTSYYWFVDDINIDLSPACFPPSDLTATVIGATTATLGWEENGTATSWTLQYGTNSSFTSGTYTQTTASETPSKDLTGLSDLTTYYARVRANCGGGNGESEWSETFTFTTKQVPVDVGDGWSDNFEGTINWVLDNGALTNAWAIGTAAKNGGSKGLYISNDGGTSNAYTVNSNTVVYATKLFTFATGQYTFAYDWKANGESGSDYLRVALIPSDVTLAASTSVPSGFGTTTLPSGWIALDDGSKLNGVTAWQSKSVTQNVTEGNYYVAFVWRNDGSVGTQPPAAIDNFSIARVTCYVPFNLTATSVSTTSATLSWAGESSSYNVRYRESVVSERFTSTTLPEGWENKQGLLSNVMNGTALTNTANWFFGANNGVFDSHARINIYGSTKYGWLITPQFVVGSDFTLNFDLALTAFSGTGAASGTCVDDRFVVLIWREDNNTWNILREWNNSGSLDVYNNIPTAGTNVSIGLSGYINKNVKIAFYGESTTSGNGDNNLHIDNVLIGGAWQTRNVTSETVSLTDLTPETSYDWQSRAICSGSPTDWSDLSTFTTIAMPPCTPPDVSISGGSTPTCSGTQQTLTANVSGGETPYSYTWGFSATGSGASTISSNAETVTVTPSNTSATASTITYKVIVNDNAGCSNSATKEIVVKKQPNPSFSPAATTLLVGGADYNALATLNADGCSSPTWTSSPSGIVTQAGGSIHAVAQGNTTVTASYAATANYCAASANLAVVVNIPHSVTISSASAACTGSGTSITASATGFTNPQYSWSASPNTVRWPANTNLATINVTATEVGNYTFTCEVTESGGGASYSIGDVLYTDSNGDLAPSGTACYVMSVSGNKFTVLNSITCGGPHYADGYVATTGMTGKAATEALIPLSPTSSMVKLLVDNGHYAKGWYIPSADEINAFASSSDGRSVFLSVGNFNTPAPHYTSTVSSEGKVTTFGVTRPGGTPTEIYSETTYSYNGNGPGAFLAKDFSIGVSASATITVGLAPVIGGFPVDPSVEECGSYTITPTVSTASCVATTWQWSDGDVSTGTPSLRDIDADGDYTFYATYSSMQQYDMITQNGIRAIVVKVPTATTDGIAVPISNNTIAPNSPSTPANISDSYIANLQEAIKVNGGNTYSGSRPGFVIPAGAAGGVCRSEATVNVTINTPNIENASNYNYIWKGGTAGNATDWNTASNWYVYSGGTYSIADVVPPSSPLKNIYIGNHNCMSNLTPNVNCDNAYANNITIASDASLTISANKTLNIKGNLINDGTFLAIDSSLVVFVGASYQSIGSAVTFSKVKFEQTNSGTKINAPYGITVTGTATFNKGIVNGNMTFNAKAKALNVTNYESFVAGTVTKKTGSLSETNFVFPTGSAAGGQPKVLGSVQVATLAGSKTTTVTFHQKSNDNGDGSHGFTLSDYPRWWNINDMCSNDGDNRFDHVSNYEYWEISAALSGITLKVNASSAAAHFSGTAPGNGANSNICAAAHYDCWKNLGGTATVSGSGGTITVSGVNIPSSITRGEVAFDGILTLGSKSENVVLPIELTSFTAICDGRSSIVEWATATERNNDFFVLERSDDAINFKEIARIAGAGNSIESLDYSYTDYGINGGDNYYRLVQVDYDGTRSVSEIVVANCVEPEIGEPDVLAYPNPFGDELTIELDNFGNRPARIEVYDVLGKLIMYKKIDSPQNSYEMMLHLGNLPPAAYNIRVSTADFVINRKVVKQ